MKTRTSKGLLLAALLLTGCLTPLQAQNYSIAWYKIAGGGGSSTNSQYSLSGTIGQQDAGGPMTGGNYSLNGGFWSLFAVQTAGAPLLNIQLAGPNSVVISWPVPDPIAFVLQQNNDLTTTNWANVGIVPTVVNGTNTVTVPPALGNMFYRLVNP